MAKQPPVKQKSVDFAVKGLLMGRFRTPDEAATHVSANYPTRAAIYEAHGQIEQRARELREGRQEITSAMRAPVSSRGV